MLQLTQSVQALFLYVAGRILESLMLRVTGSRRDIPYIVAISFSTNNKRENKMF
jgi:hypothetical protein